MPISNYTTKVDSMNTIAEIQKMLANHGADKIMMEFENKIPIGVTFQVRAKKGFIAFKLPANWEGVLRAMEKDPKIPRASRNKAQALRVAWRIIRDWTEAQLAMVEAELATIDQVFLPYAMMKSGNTVYNDFKTDNFLQIEG